MPAHFYHVGEDGVASIFTERPVKQPEHRLHAPRNELFKHLLVYDNVLLLVSAKGSRFNTPPGNPLTFCVYDLATCVQVLTPVHSVFLRTCA